MDRTTRWGLPALVGVTALAGAVVAAWGWLEIDVARALAFAAVAGLVELLPAKVRNDVSTTLGSVVVFTAVLVGGTALAVCTTIGAVVVAVPRYSDRRVVRGLFNFGQLTLSAAAAGLVFWAAGGVVGEPALVVSWIALLAAAGAYTIVNHLLIATVILLSSGERLRSTLSSVVGTAAVLQVFYAGLSVIAAALLQEAGVAALVFLVIPALVARYGLLGFQKQHEAYDRLVSALMKATELKDGHTRGHGERSAQLAVEVAREMGHSYEQQQVVRYAALLHDLGKLGVPRAVLTRPGRLEQVEYERIKHHPAQGCDLLGEVDFLQPALAGIRHHHERYDGRGYPDALSGEAIPMVARVIAACDAFDSMTSTMSYRRPIGVDEALAELARNAGSQFDPEVVAAIIRRVKRRGWTPVPEPFVGPTAFVRNPARGIHETGAAS